MKESGEYRHHNILYSDQCQVRLPGEEDRGESRGEERLLSSPLCLRLVSLPRRGVRLYSHAQAVFPNRRHWLKRPAPSLGFGDDSHFLAITSKHDDS